MVKTNFCLVFILTTFGCVTRPPLVGLNRVAVQSTPPIATQTPPEASSELGPATEMSTDVTVQNDPPKIAESKSGNTDFTEKPRTVKETLQKKHSNGDVINAVGFVAYVYVCQLETEERGKCLPPHFAIADYLNLGRNKWVTVFYDNASDTEPSLPKVGDRIAIEGRIENKGPNLMGVPRQNPRLFHMSHRETYLVDNDLPRTTYSDGSWSVRELRQQEDSDLNERRSVVGYVADINLCRCPPGRICSTCPGEYLTLCDTKTEVPGECISVRGLPTDSNGHLRMPSIRVGGRYRISGTIRKVPAKITPNFVTHQIEFSKERSLVFDYGSQQMVRW